MSWFSILPAELSVYEVWAVRFFLFLATLSIGPWALVFIYDFLYYLYRLAAYEVSGVQGSQRPRAPSLMERPDGSSRHRRGLGLGSGSGSGLGSGANSPVIGSGSGSGWEEGEDGPKGAGTGLGRLNEVEVEEGLRRRRDGELGSGQ